MNQIKVLEATPQVIDSVKNAGMLKASVDNLGQYVSDFEFKYEQPVQPEYKVLLNQRDQIPDFLSGKFEFDQIVHGSGGFGPAYNDYLIGVIPHYRNASGAVSASFSPCWLWKEINGYNEVKHQHLTCYNEIISWEQNNDSMVRTSSQDVQPGYLMNKITGDGSIQVWEQTPYGDNRYIKITLGIPSGTAGLVYFKANGQLTKIGTPSRGDYTLRCINGEVFWDIN